MPALFRLIAIASMLHIIACMPHDSNMCEFTMQYIPGLNPLVQTDDNGKSCRGNISLPFCRGACRTRESGIHTFPYREQESYVCAIIGDAIANVTLTDCDEGADSSVRYVIISKATACGCRKLPLNANGSP